MNLEKEIKRCSQFELVSFDIFDTLIERQVCVPTDVFYLAGFNYFKDKNKAIFFKDCRIKAEAEARKNSSTGETTLDDIYKVLQTGIKNSTDAEALKKFEVEIELEQVHPREELVQLCNTLVKKGMKIALISDMYLTSDIIQKMLKKCGIEESIPLFVSCECNCNKISGKLFQHVDKAVGITPQKHIHYGDSYKADYKGAKLAGIIPRFILRKKLIQRLFRSLYARIRNKCR